MKVIKMKEGAYKELILYATKICDSFSLVKYKMLSEFEKSEKVVQEIITSNPKYSKENILNNFSLEMIDDVYEEYKNNEEILSAWERECEENYYSCEDFFQLQGISSIDKYKERRMPNFKGLIKKSMELLLFELKAEELLEKFKEEIISVESKVEDEGNIKYLFKIDEKTKEYLLNEANHIFDWDFPKLENLTLYINGKVWLFSMETEGFFYIYCRDKEEYEFLKSIGIKFKNQKFVKT